MIVLALLLIPAIILPFLFKFSPFMLVLFRIVNYVIIILFALEYFSKLYVAESRRAYATNPWHILDLFIVALPVINFIPWISFGGIGKISPLLRLLRVTRMFAVAGRTVKRAIPPGHVEKRELLVSHMKINILADGKTIKSASKQDIGRMAHFSYGWVDLQEISEADIDIISDDLKIPSFVLASKIIKESYPKIDFFKDFTSIFIRDTKLQSEGAGIKDIDVSGNKMLIILRGSYIATISAGKSELFDHLIGDGQVMEKKEEFIASILYSIFRKKIADYEEVVRLLEQKAIAIEEIPVSMARPSFLEDTFYFKKEIQKIHGNLWHFTQVLKAISSGKVLPGSLKDGYLPLFGILYDDSIYLFETSENVRDNLISLIEFYINTKSVGLNSVMRILAVITSIGLIPSIISGLFGVNLVDSPYHASIIEVFFLEISIMLLTAYAFYRRGWLK